MPTTGYDLLRDRCSSEEDVAQSPHRRGGTCCEPGVARGAQPVTRQVESAEGGPECPARNDLSCVLSEAVTLLNLSRAGMPGFWAPVVE